MPGPTSSPDYLPREYLRSTTELYNTYQERYAEQPRESDKVLIRLIASAIAPRLETGEKISLLDIGCSTGNLLFHLKNALPGLDLTGGDLAESAIEGCRTNPRLAGINFQVMDIFDLPVGRFDVIVANAVAVYLDSEQYEQSIESVAKSLKKDGWFLAFEWLHPFEQEVQIVERSRSHPDGLKFYFRPFSATRAILSEHGFGDVQFHPFNIPIDLPRDVAYTDNRTGFEDLNTYTMKAETGERLLFRGTLFQPWCHLMARKTN